MRITTSACLVLLLTAGFAMAPSAHAQTGSVTPGANYTGELPSRELGFVHDGRMRSYRDLYRPAGLRGRAPAVLVLHGGLGSSEDSERRTGFDEQARRGRFVAVYPGDARVRRIGRPLQLERARLLRPGGARGRRRQSASSVP